MNSKFVENGSNMMKSFKKCQLGRKMLEMSEKSRSGEKIEIW